GDAAGADHRRRHEVRHVRPAGRKRGPLTRGSEGELHVMSRIVRDCALPRLGAAALSCIMAFALAPAVAQDGAAAARQRTAGGEEAAAGAVPRMANGKPDLSGVWWGGGGGGGPGSRPGGPEGPAL